MENGGLEYVKSQVEILYKMADYRFFDSVFVKSQKKHLCMHFTIPYTIFTIIQPSFPDAD
jgi:hypothetical protein